MKNVLAVIARFCTVSLVFELLYLFSLVLAVSMRPGTTTILNIIIAGALLTAPLAVIAGCFSSFFTLNRLYSSRFAGYLSCFLMVFFIMVAASLGLRLRPIPLQQLLEFDLGFFPGHPALLSWFTSISSASWTILVLANSTFALFIASFWGLTRLFGKRPLIGAFIMPACFVLAIFTHSVFLSGSVDIVFSYLGLSLARPVAAAILAALVSFALGLADLIMARPPSPGYRYG